ncbi:MAG: hypothetical protein AYL33_001850 [Candidatus Bathyarchaeota archaeon B63]|nr:MAG: hypothetical protein AYL33_001850 [Candidatus Bathyarchaeota archaeon B63]
MPEMAMNHPLRGLDLNFIPDHQNLSDILMDNDLAALGDAFINFAYSLASSFREGKPVGRKLSNMKLASALRRSGLRRILPSRVDRHQQANAAEALIAYAWLIGITSLREIIQIMNETENVEEALEALLRRIWRKYESSLLKT